MGFKISSSVEHDLRSIRILGRAIVPCQPLPVVEGEDPG